MRQEELIGEVLSQLAKTPEVPELGCYLTLQDAYAIVDKTLASIRDGGNQAELRYMTGHRHRLAETLTMIPKAEHPGASFLDVGCYGYMAYWASRHLCYDHVEGIEWLPNIADIEVERTIEADGDHFSFLVRNFDISEENWTLNGDFDTITLLETLKHVSHDPSGVLTRIASRLSSNGVLVASVPNSVSYKSLTEILNGAPPRTHWFFHPDLSLEPRHAYEYTPIFFKAILRAAGFKECAFRTICAYADRMLLDDMFAIGAALSIPANMFGDTLIAQMRKTPDTATIRFPDLIYDADGYYRTTYPALLPHLKTAMAHFSSILDAASRASEEIPALQARIEQYARQADAERGATGSVSARAEATEQSVLRLKAENETYAQQIAHALTLTGACMNAASSAIARAEAAEQSVLRLKAENETYAQQNAQALTLVDAYMKIAEDARGALTKPPFGRWFFKADGSPRRALRKILFHNSGIPRSTFRILVLKGDGYPRKPFQRWMNSNAYRKLPGAISLPAHRSKKRKNAAGIPPKARASQGGDRSWLKQLLFRPDGRPVKPLRWVLFRADGEPRNLFRRIVLKKNGTIRPAFRYRG